MKRTDHYDLTDFADDGTLRISLLLWLILIYLSRYVVIIALGAISSFISGRRGVDLSGLTTLYSSVDFLLASLPALLVIAANSKRQPAGHKVVRFVWGHGRGLLICSVLLDLCLLGYHWPERIHQVSLLYVFGALIDLYLLVYLLSSRRVQDTFAAFPSIPVVPKDEDP
ncbi:MAG: DUF2919 family protein [Pseudomonadales bacterium]|jgi:hypothetical protein|nr:DUF2919 family protein [Pseudomonadales bacterium]MDP7359650.1 DUF2919 family protein [Pseudomonadales bacterium]MDP7596091.1 DUF2919 family protein [Pseudomonadales bacterium]HJN48950.1 DUF2919 family protein [Pseudomonadales bacterium]|tara:strand:+ start:5446 stop:5952 length:507 start_codon:yes stop_codon:yes gene_type:complete